MVFRCENCGTKYNLFNKTKNRCKECYRKEYDEHTKNQTKRYNKNHYQLKMAKKYKMEMIKEFKMVCKILHIHKLN